VSETPGNSSIIGELDEKLNDIFGRDESDNNAFEDNDASPLDELKGLMLTIDWEINDETIAAITKEADELKKLYVNDKLMPLLLKMLSSLTSYLNAKRGKAHSDTLNRVKSVFNALERVVEDNDLASQEKREIVDEEIQKFKIFKSAIMTPQIKTPSTVENREPVNPEAEIQGKTDEPIQLVVPAPIPDLTESSVEEPVFEKTDDDDTPIDEHFLTADEAFETDSEKDETDRELEGTEEPEHPEIQASLREVQVPEENIFPSEIDSPSVEVSADPSETDEPPVSVHSEDDPSVVQEMKQADEFAPAVPEQENTGDESSIAHEESSEVAFSTQSDSIHLVNENDAPAASSIEDMETLQAEEYGPIDSEESETAQADSASPPETKTEGIVIKAEELTELTAGIERLKETFSNELDSIRESITNLVSATGSIREDLKQTKSQFSELQKSFAHFEQHIASKDIKEADDPDKSNHAESNFGVETENVSEIPKKDGEISAPEEEPVSSEKIELRDLDGLEDDFPGQESNLPDPAEDFDSDIGDLSENNQTFDVYESDPLLDGTFEVVDETDEEAPEKGQLNVTDCYLFEIGGKKYAIDEKNVIKSCKGNRRSLKTARKKGTFTMIEAKPPFAGLTRGIGTHWKELTAKELKKTKFSFLDGDRVQGAYDTSGGGVLFLGNSDRRAVLFSDNPPEKYTLTKDDELNPSHDQPYVTAQLIKQKARGSEAFSLLDAEQLI
jgi:hypothetical protein